MSDTTSELIAQQILNGNVNKRTWGDILYNVKVYGAVGDGATDDTASIQSTIDYAISIGGKAVFFPHGTYKVTALTGLSSVVLFGDNAVFSGISNTITQLGAPLASSYNVKDYGAKGDGVTDDSTSFNNAISALTIAGGGILYIPLGKYVLSLPLTITNIDIVIKGEGIQLSQLFFTGSNGIVYSSNNLFTDTIQIRDLSIVTITDNLYTGISTSFPSNAGSPWRNTIIENVVVAGSTTVSDYNSGSNNSQSGFQNWATGIILNNSAVSVIRDCIVRCGGSGTTGGIGIYTKGYTVDVLIQGCKVYGADTAYKKDDTGEGFVVDNCMGINVDYGVYINQGATVQSGVYASIQNCHFSYFNVGIIALWHPQITVENCLLYRNGAVTTCIDISLSKCERSKILGNTCIVSTGGGSGDGIVVDSNDCLIQDNIVQERSTGVWIRTGVTGVVIQDNKINGNTTNILDQGTGTYYGKRFYAISTLFTPTGTSFTADTTIPSGIFTAKPTSCFMMSASTTEDILGFYDYDSASSTATNARFRLVRKDGAAFAGVSTRFNVVVYE